MSEFARTERRKTREVKRPVHRQDVNEAKRERVTAEANSKFAVEEERWENEKECKQP